MKKKNFNKDMIDVMTGGILGGATIGVINNIDMPEGAFPAGVGNSLKIGTSAVIGAGVLNLSAKKMKKYL